MGMDVRHSGEICIDPPILVDDLKGTEFHPDAERGHGKVGNDVRLHVVEQPVAGMRGAYRRLAVSVTAAMDVFSGYEVGSDLQVLVNRWGEDRVFTGHIHCVDSRDGSQWRYFVRGGEVVRAEPTLTWPDADCLSVSADARQRTLDEDDVERYAKYIAGHPDAQVGLSHIMAARAVLGALAAEGRLLKVEYTEPPR